MNPGALGGIASTSGVKDPRVLQKGGVKTEVCFKVGTPKYGVSEVWHGGRTACVQRDYRSHVSHGITAP